MLACRPNSSSAEEWKISTSAFPVSLTPPPPSATPDGLPRNPSPLRVPVGTFARPV
jgi:hypothetical protein